MPLKLDQTSKLSYLENIESAIRSSYPLVEKHQEILDSFKRINNLFKLFKFDLDYKSGCYSPLEINPHSGMPRRYVLEELIDDVNKAARVTSQSGIDEEFRLLLRSYLIDQNKDLDFLRKSYGERKYYSKIMAQDPQQNILNALPKFYADDHRAIVTDLLDDCWEVVEIYKENHGQNLQSVNQLYTDKYNVHRPRAAKQLAQQIIDNFEVVPQEIQRITIGPFYFAGNKGYSSHPKINKIMNEFPESYILELKYSRLRTVNPEFVQDTEIPIKQSLPRKILVVSADVATNIHKKLMQEYEYIVGVPNGQPNS